MKERTKGNAPRLGIFWFVPAGEGRSRFVELSETADHVPLVGGFRTLETGHVDHWRAVKRADPSLKGVPYEAYPRGRANYREADDAWLLLADRKLLRTEFVEIVLEAWALPRDRVRIMSDPHYRSTRDVGAPWGME
ncbi:hypothetical protein [Amorphus coralli]|uniref:hypothetical protein n=1 Tax=Amorphus coralli TaxID=340680 RepID=UPI00036D3334|nr:hypothetical protein [Amorphus coralli]